MDQDNNVTGKTAARRNRREVRNGRREEDNLVQVLRMTGIHGVGDDHCVCSETLQGRMSCVRVLG